MLQRGPSLAYPVQNIEPGATWLGDRKRQGEWQYPLEGIRGMEILCQRFHQEVHPWATGNTSPVGHPTWSTGTPSAMCASCIHPIPCGQLSLCAFLTAAPAGWLLIKCRKLPKSVGPETTNWKFIATFGKTKEKLSHSAWCVEEQEKAHSTSLRFLPQERARSVEQVHTTKVWDSLRISSRADGQ